MLSVLMNPFTDLLGLGVLSVLGLLFTKKDSLVHKGSVIGIVVAILGLGYLIFAKGLHKTTKNIGG